MVVGVFRITVVCRAQRSSRWGTRSATPKQATSKAASSKPVNASMSAKRFVPPPAASTDDKYVVGGKGGFILSRQTPQPLNPLIDRSSSSKTEFITEEMMRQKIRKRNRQSELDDLKLSEDQVDNIVNKYAMQQWYAPAWRFVQHLTPRKLQKINNLLHAALLVTALLLIWIVVKLYKSEMDLYFSMEPDEQKDYELAIMHVRYSKVMEITQKILEEHDPLGTLPIQIQSKLMVAEMRRRGWCDEEFWLKDRGGPSFIDEMDLRHMLFWTVMWYGALLHGKRGYYGC